LDHRGAIDLYQLVLEHFPEGVNAPAAQWNLAVEFAGVGQHANAALAMEQYTDRWPEADDREAAMWWAAQFREKAEPAAAERAYVRYLAEYRGEHPDHSILAQESLWRSQRDADRPDAADRERQALLALWTELQQAEPRWTPRARRAVAQAATVDLETELAHFLATGIPGDDSVSFEDSVAMLDAWSTRVLETAKSIEHVEYAEAMATALAEAWAAVADVYPQHALNAVQGADVDAPAVTPEIRTRALAERCLQIGETAKRWTPWQERALTLLQARYPEDYPVVHEERRLE
jgi:hypothetical protein